MARICRKFWSGGGEMGPLPSDRPATPGRITFDTTMQRVSHRETVSVDEASELIPHSRVNARRRYFPWRPWDGDSHAVAEEHCHVVPGSRLLRPPALNRKAQERIL